ncbi:MAG: sirohydrochlorin cobaltochelatase [Desulfobulbaceae bacterium]|nr:sirohydrochlorin cobaltochelatase [Desulfobulbaceae bacterium]
MDEKEMAYAKQGVMLTKNWDCFQQLIRRCLRKNDDKQQLSSTANRLLHKVTVGALLLVSLFSFAPQAEAMTRTLEKGPAIVIAAFGTTTDARETYDFFEQQLRQELPEAWLKAPITWAYTSEIVRERANKKFAEQGDPQRYRSLLQVLADLEDQGYRQIAVQSLHIFPGQEYDEMEKVLAAFRTLGLHIEYGGTLLQKWEMLFEAIDGVADEFLPEADGCNLLVGHGSPESFSPANSTYLGLDRYLSHKYAKTFVGTVDGVLTREQALDKAIFCSPKRVRIVPFMYVAGDHIMNDIMGTTPDKGGVPSWAMELQSAGVKVETVFTEYQGRKVFKGLGFYRKINDIFIKELIKSLQRLQQ